ncbi:hypothetical protein FZEAL_6679 [Fusarium zealandicum]|uniref:Uncharacterized protein n=1 Tax=Fusarium zealandicum TaxID=1053134 RepID=A0A8H4UIB4_9HYPO|nr:hypothetical protein FZEAL_6679 [Fusarium zealandicum]
MALSVDTPQASTNGPSRGKIVVLNGFPGTGKLTIFKNIEAQLSSQDVQVVDNHLIIDPAQAVDRGLNHYYLRRQMRKVYYNEIRKMASQGCLVLMTACLVDNEADLKVLDEHLDIVRGTDISMVWVNIRCEQQILEQRVTSLERVQGSKTKLTDVEMLRRMIKRNRLLIPSSRRSKLDGIDLTTSSLDVSGTIEEAVDKVSAVMQGESSRL